MSEEPNINDASDDQEMLDAIAAAFGDDAIDSLEEESSAASGSEELSQDLDGLVRQIDNETLESKQDDGGQKASPTTTSRKLEKYVILEMADTTFGIPMDNVHEIQRVPNVTPLPGVPAWVLGVTNLRGNVVSVVDLQALFGIKPSDDVMQGGRRLVMAHSLIDELDTGLIVDSVRGIRTIYADTISAPTGDIDEQIAPYLHGMTEVDDKLVALLDIDKFLISEEFRQFDAA